MLREFSRKAPIGKVSVWLSQWDSGVIDIKMLLNRHNLNFFYG